MAIDLPALIRSGRIRDGHRGAGKLSFARGEERLALVQYYYDLIEPDFAWLDLKYRCSSRKGEFVDQPIRLLYTQPNYGGRRWWMRCPRTGRRLAKLYVPVGGDNFASRDDWQLVYGSTRWDGRSRAFGKLFQLQRKLGCEERWGAEPVRPRGMWEKTFKAHMAEFHKLEACCGAETDLWMDRIRSGYT